MGEVQLAFQDAAHDALGMNGRRETGQRQRIEKENRAKDNRAFDKHVSGIGAESRLGHPPADNAAQAAFFRLLKQDDTRQKQTDDNFNHIQKAYEDGHFSSSFQKISVNYTEKKRGLQSFVWEKSPIAVFAALSNNLK